MMKLFLLIFSMNDVLLIGGFIIIMFRGQENLSSNRWWFSFADDRKMEELYYLLT